MATRSRRDRARADLGLLAACGLVTATNFCVPSTVLALLERRLRNGPLAT